MSKAAQAQKSTSEKNAFEILYILMLEKHS